MLKITTLPVGMLGTNCYLAFRPEDGLLLVVDPGGDAPAILEAARRVPYRRAAVLLTHAHFDHIGALGAVARALPAEAIRLSPADEPLYRSPENAMPPYCPPVSDLPDTTGDLAVDGMEVIAAPGHSPGGALYYFPADGVLFSGDTLFAGSVGRTDLPGGDWEALTATLTGRVLTLPPETRVYPGHGPATTIGRERAENPYCRG